MGTPSDRLRVVVVPEWYPTPDDPIAGVFVRDQARAIARLHDVTVLVPSASARGSVVEAGVRELAPAVSRRGGRAARMARLRALDAATRDLRPDVLHAHVFSAGLLAVLVGRRRGVPVVVSEHLSSFVVGAVRGWDARVARFVLRHADRVCPVSDVLARSMRELEPRGHYEVVPNVVDLDAFGAGPASVERLNAQAQPSAGATRRLLVVASLTRLKGLPVLLTALERLRKQRPEVVLDVVGDGPERGALEAAASALGPGVVTFHGRLPRPEVAAMMRRADALVVPSFVETFGIVVVEALGCGLPVVATDGCGAAPLAAELGGAVVRARDPDSLREGLSSVLDRPNGVPASAAAELRRRYGPGPLAERWDALYRSLAPRPAGRWNLRAPRSRDRAPAAPAEIA